MFNAIFKGATSAVFDEARRRNMRIISGLNGMASCDLSVTDTFRDPITKKQHPMCNSMEFDDQDGRKSALIIKRQVEELIASYHRQDRLLYALIPRFLVTSTPASMEVWKALMQDYAAEDVRFHTHISENLKLSVANVAAFKEQAKAFYGEMSEQYREIRTLVTQVDIFNYYGLVNNRSSYAHGIRKLHIFQ